VSKIFLFWDNSNIFLSARLVADEREGSIGRSAVRIDFTNTFKLAAAGREIGKAVVVGSVPPEQREIRGQVKKGVDRR
jgi:hypothetical protein